MSAHPKHEDAPLDAYQKQLERMVALRTAELTASVERYKLLVESTHAIPWEIDGATFVFSYISPQASILLGYESQDMVHFLSLPDLLHPDDRDRVLEQLGALALGALPDLDLDYRMITGHECVVDVRSVVTADRKHGPCRSVLRGITLDMTRQKKLEMELRQAQKLESVGRLAAGVAHEINTPVQFVSDSVHFLRDAMTDLLPVIALYREVQQAIAAGTCDATLAERMAQAAADADLDYVLEHAPKALDRSLDGLHRVATIVRSMKEYAHPDQKEMAAVDLNKAIQSTLTIARNEYKYVADVETNLGDLPLVMCHAGDFSQAILNIIINAAHAIELRVRGTDRRGRITVHTRRIGDAVEIQIGDTGGGISPEVRDRIFDPFFTTKEVGKGTGQGLAIARSVILEKHGGELTFDSAPGRGTTFTIRLPIESQRSRGTAA